MVLTACASMDGSNRQRRHHENSVLADGGHSHDSTGMSANKHLNSGGYRVISCSKLEVLVYHTLPAFKITSLRMCCE